ncbi:pantoate--beta-alanine ligase [Thiomicrospira cyclica]|uniref:Pantothenate synthetase n=1 Tax=Thiomicrospira cyclica (strain DSM 14477 / JCM 11371 / ALM1) TaxID=717773 RepID=F6D982_THICA|nr:pantoate--beta-alanine ligase [Thiomicrospira cyclica]AEG32009.1 Pantothenate synthetase [Thiomicrospira cyclica ALM1]
MELVHDIASLRAQLARWQQAGKRWGLIPTMGNLHAGHLSLVRLAQAEVDCVVVSIFVNPLQFGEDEDFAQYPRTLAADCDALRRLGCDLVFCPDVSELYPAQGRQTRLQADPQLASRFEGALRPGHFDGVVTVVAKLFNLVQPHLAVFGQKDYQQLCVIQAMVADLNWPIELLRGPIARDTDGLALSSRNQYLDARQRKIAPQLYQVLQDLAHNLTQPLQPLTDASPALCWQQLQADATEKLLALGFDAVDYIAWVDQERLTEVTVAEQPSVLLVVARLGTTRLLDNLEL